jgi:hypothetical protein
MATERKRGDGPVRSHNWAMSEQGSKALKVHAAEWGIPESVILDYLCCTHLRAVKIVRWCDAPRDEPGADPGDEASGTVPMVPIGGGKPPAPLDSAAPGPGKGRGPDRARRRVS